VTLYGVFGSYGVLKKVAITEPKDYYKALWSKSAEVPVWIGSCKFEDEFDGILNNYNATMFGAARVTKGTEEALVTLSDCVGLITNGKLSTHMSTDDVSTTPIAIARDSPILGAIKKMISHNIRRLFIQGDQDKFISDRTLIDYMFSPKRLEVARDHPEAWIDEEVSKVPTKNPRRCKTGDLDEAAESMGSSPDDCLMTDKSQMISKWDLVVMPWRAGRLAVEGN